MPTAEREKLIRSVWENIGRPRWDEDVHGTGLPLVVPIHQNMRLVRPGQPIGPVPELEFRLMTVIAGDTVVRSIVCEDMVVDTLAP